MSGPDVEICAGESIETAILNLDRYDQNKGSFFGWLRGFARNKVRETGRHGYASAVDFSNREQNEQSIGPDLTTLRLAMEKLSPADQLMILLRDLNQLPYDGIGVALGVTEQACRQRHRRAMARLREAIENIHTEEEGQNGAV